MSKTSMIAALAGAALTMSAANAVVYNVGTFSTGPASEAADFAVQLDETQSIPGASYTSYSLVVEWSAISGGPWSSEAIWALTDLPAASANVFYSDAGASPDAAFNGDPATLTWSGFLDTPYTGGDNLWFNAQNTFTGSLAQWANVELTLGFDMIEPPECIDLGVLGIEGDSIDFDTFGSGYDTEMGLYNASGSLLASNDDSGGTFQSAIETGALAEGTYYIAVGEFNTSFGPAFDVTFTPSTTFPPTGGTSLLNADGVQVSSLEAGVGEIVWYCFDIVPSPGAAALFGLAGLVGVRRRR